MSNEKTTAMAIALQGLKATDPNILQIVEEAFSKDESAIIERMRTLCSSELDGYNDRAILAAHEYWYMSEDNGKPETFIDWVKNVSPTVAAQPKDYATQQEEASQIIVDEEETRTEAEVEAANRDFDFNNPVNFLAEGEGPKTLFRMTPEEQQEALDDLSPRRLLSVATDVLRERRTAEITNILSTFLGKIHGLQVTTESDVLVCIAENARLVDFLVSLYGLLDIQPKVTKVTEDMRVETGNLRFIPKKGVRFTLSEIELGHIAAFVKVKELLESQEKLVSQTAVNEKLRSDLTSAQQQLTHKREQLEIAEKKLEDELQKPKAKPFLNRDGVEEVYVQWSYPGKKTSKMLSFYLSVVEGATPNEKGIYKTALFARTKYQSEAVLFPSVEVAKAAIARIIRNEKHIDPASKVEPFRLKTAKILRRMEVEA